MYLNQDCKFRPDGNELSDEPSGRSSLIASFNPFTMTPSVTIDVPIFNTRIGNLSFASTPKQPRNPADTNGTYCPNVSQYWYSEYEARLCVVPIKRRIIDKNVVASNFKTNYFRGITNDGIPAA